LLAAEEAVRRLAWRSAAGLNPLSWESWAGYPGFPDVVGEIASGIPWVLQLRMLQVVIRFALESVCEQRDILFAKQPSRDIEGGRLPCRTETIRS
jgi:hypothetical protein